jgi:hypothetical protein
MSGPSILEGICVLDFGRYIAGPFAAAMLGDMGAEVIRIERREGSEDRFIAPVGPSGEGAMFLGINRNKKGMTLDPMTAKGQEIAHRLVATSDVVVANLPINILKRMRLDYDTLQAIKPDIILVNPSTFGPDGPYANRVGFDTVAQAMSGAMSLTGFPGPPGSTSSSSGAFRRARFTSSSMLVTPKRSSDRATSTQRSNLSNPSSVKAISTRPRIRAFRTWVPFLRRAPERRASSGTPTAPGYLRTNSSRRCAAPPT